MYLSRTVLCRERTVLEKVGHMLSGFDGEQQACSTGATPVRRASTVVVAPEVAARIVARQRAGECLSEIGRTLHLTPGEVRTVLRTAERTEPVEVSRR